MFEVSSSGGIGCGAEKGGWASRFGEGSFRISDRSGLDGPMELGLDCTDCPWMVRSVSLLGRRAAAARALESRQSARGSRAWDSERTGCNVARGWQGKWGKVIPEGGVPRPVLWA